MTNWCRFCTMLAGALLAANVASAQPSSDAGVPSGQAGLRVYVDPSTGELLDRPAGEDLLDTLDAAPAGRSLPSSRLVEEAGPTAAHGTTVDLQGRFRSSMTIGIAPDAKTVTNCTNAPAADASSSMSVVP